MAFKVLKANRFCGNDAQVREALEFAFHRIKPTDVICIGMWGKYKDQVGQNSQWVREILAKKCPVSL